MTAFPGQALAFRPGTAPTRVSRGGKRDRAVLFVEGTQAVSMGVVWLHGLHPRQPPASTADSADVSVAASMDRLRRPCSIPRRLFRRG